jgi:hypothetical protein
MPASLLDLPVEVVQQIIACLSNPSRRSLALALVGRPRPDGPVTPSDEHVTAVRALQRLLLPRTLNLQMADQGISPAGLPESEHHRCRPSHTRFAATAATRAFLRTKGLSGAA